MTDFTQGQVLIILIWTAVTAVLAYKTGKQDGRHEGYLKGYQRGQEESDWSDKWSKAK